MVLSLGCVAYILAVLFPILLAIKHALREITKLDKDKVVIITGASSGIGRACAKEFYSRGCKVVLCSRNLTKLQEVKEDLIASSAKDTSNEPLIVQLDITDPDSISKAVEVINNKFPNGIHILLNNAGMSYRGDILSTAMDVQRKVMETNYFGQIALTKSLLPGMLKLPFNKEKTRAHIISVNSIQGIISTPQRSAYTASKFALTSFFDCLRAELSGLGIRVCNIHPSYVKTNISIAAIRGDGTDFGIMDKNQADGMDPSYVANKIVNAVQYNKEEVVISGFIPILAIWIRFFLPFLYFRLMDRRSKKKLE